MATFTLSSNQGRTVFGDRRANNGIYTGPASYATGGDSITAANVQLSNIRYLALGVASNGSASRLLVYDTVNGKILWYVPNTGSEVANATDLSAYTATLLAEGR